MSRNSSLEFLVGGTFQWVKLRVSSHKVPVMKGNYLNWTINPITVSLMVGKTERWLPPTSSRCIMCEFHKGLTWKSMSSDPGTVDRRVGLGRPSCKQGRGRRFDSPGLKRHQSHFSSHLSFWCSLSFRGFSEWGHDSTIPFPVLWFQHFILIASSCTRYTLFLQLLSNQELKILRSPWRT